MSMDKTREQYMSAVRGCKDIFIRKARDYGTSWRVLRQISVVDQLFIKVQRIRNIQNLGTQKIADDIPAEFRALVNYGIIGLIQLELGSDAVEDVPAEKVADWYDAQIDKAFTLMQAKNHDFGEAWRNLSPEGIADLIMMKVMRMRQIIANGGKTLVSEGLDANYLDIINYALFALMLDAEKSETAAGRKA